MQKWGKRPIYFKNAEIMQNALIMQTLRPLTMEKHEYKAINQMSQKLGKIQS